MTYLIPCLPSWYGKELGPAEEIVVMGLDSATPGRMAITFYRELKGSEFLNRIEMWHMMCAWPQNFGKDKKFVGTPAPRDIAEAAYGRRLDDKLRKAVVERFLPCIVDGSPLPRDLVASTTRRASNRQGFDDKWEWEKCLGIACALFKGSQIERDYLVHGPEAWIKQYLRLSKKSYVLRDVYGNLLMGGFLRKFAKAELDASKGWQGIKKKTKTNEPLSERQLLKSDWYYPKPSEEKLILEFFQANLADKGAHRDEALVLALSIATCRDVGDVLMLTESYHAACKKILGEIGPRNSSNPSKTAYPSLRVPMLFAIDNIMKIPDGHMYTNEAVQLLASFDWRTSRLTDSGEQSQSESDSTSLGCGDGSVACGSCAGGH